MREGARKWKGPRNGVRYWFRFEVNRAGARDRLTTTGGVVSGHLAEVRVVLDCISKVSGRSIYSYRDVS